MFHVLCLAQQLRSVIDQSEAGRDSVVQQLQSTSESLIREKAELVEKLGTVEHQVSLQSDARVALEKELEEVRGKLTESISQSMQYCT